MRILIVSDYLRNEDVENGHCLSDACGRMLRSYLRQFNIPKAECHFTSVFPTVPKIYPDVRAFCGPREEGIKGMPAVEAGYYVRASYETELMRLQAEITTVKPNIILLLGHVAAWAVMGEPKIKALRGTITSTKAGTKVLITYHPSTIFKQYKLLPVFLFDLHKLTGEWESPVLTRPTRLIHTEPCYADLLAFERDYIKGLISLDIETAHGQITCLGIAPSPDRALVVPFTDDTKPDHNYWSDTATEVRVWEWVRHICSTYPIVGQNFNYDIKFLWQAHGIPVPKAAHDLMLLHHALQPELEKGLGFMSTLYTKELAWKFMRPKHTAKKED